MIIVNFQQTVLFIPLLYNPTGSNSSSVAVTWNFFSRTASQLQVYKVRGNWEGYKKNSTICKCLSKVSSGDEIRFRSDLKVIIRSKLSYFLLGTAWINSGLVISSFVNTQTWSKRFECFSLVILSLYWHSV